MNKQLIRQAYREVPFFMRKIEDIEIDWELPEGEFEKIPLLSKEEILGDSLCLLSPRYLSKFYRKELMQANTSGSTGKCLEICWSFEDCRRSLYSLWYYRKKYYGIYTWDKRCQFYTISRLAPEEEGKRYRNNSLEFSKNDLSEERLLEIYREMEGYQPVWLLLQPSIAELLCFIKKKYSLPDLESVRYIEMTGELFTDELRRELQEQFQCQVANQYGMNEVNSIAYECPEGNFHCMEDNVFVEILDDDGQPLSEGECGDIYVTTCHNQVMPFIRYKTGDKGSVECNTCSCGNKGRILHLREGRDNDWILTRDGRKINAYVFMRAIEAVNALTDHCIIQCQVIQNDYEAFEIRLVLDEPLEEVPRLFVENIGQMELRNADYQFFVCDGLMPEETGKRRFFLNKILNECINRGGDEQETG